MRDQANKTFDIFVSRVRRYASNLPESVLPPPTASTVNGGIPRMSTPHNDTSWTGWAISSFTNKIATASGDIEAKPTTSTLQISLEPRSASVPLIPNMENPRPNSTTTISELRRMALTRPVVPNLVSTSAEQLSQGAQEESDEIDDAWGEMGEDSFFDAPITPALAIPIPFDDGGEPDFAGWLSSQAKAKTRAPLPKGLSRPSTTIVTNGRPHIAQAVSTSSIDTGASTKKLAPTPSKPNGTKLKPPETKPIILDTKPKESAADDDWGEAWD